MDWWTDLLSILPAINSKVEYNIFESETQNENSKALGICRMKDIFMVLGLMLVIALFVILFY